jgi:hypothetical protein
MESEHLRQATLEEVISLLRGLMSGENELDEGMLPWMETYMPAPVPGGRISATDRLSWWFRPASGGNEGWDRFFNYRSTVGGMLGDRKGFSPVEDPFFSQPTSPQFRSPSENVTPSGPWADLRLILSEPEPELLDGDAEAVVTCLYDFIHAIGRGNIQEAMSCISDDYHSLEDDRDVDRLGLIQQITMLLDSLRGWDFDISLVEIPQPILHPKAILIYAEIQIDAVNRRDGARRIILERRIAAFHQQNREWLITALCPLKLEGK